MNESRRTQAHEITLTFRQLQSQQTTHLNFHQFVFINIHRIIFPSTHASCQSVRVSSAIVFLFFVTFSVSRNELPFCKVPSRFSSGFRHQLCFSLHIAAFDPLLVTLSSLSKSRMKSVIFAHFHHIISPSHTTGNIQQPFVCSYFKLFCHFHMYAIERNCCLRYRTHWFDPSCMLFGTCLYMNVLFHRKSAQRNAHHWKYASPICFQSAGSHLLSKTTKKRLPGTTGKKSAADSANHNAKKREAALRTNM